jgi:hypothetical protein
MLEDIRNHSATPTQTENEWMNANPFAALARVAILGIVAAAIVLAYPAADPPPPTQVAIKR